VNVKKLNLLNIRTDGGTQPRLELDQNLVKEYAEVMREGVVFPPVEVFHDGSEYWLVDGFHRYFGYKANGLTSIEAIVHTGTLREAQFYAWKANNKHGNRLKAEDIRAILRIMLTDEEYSKWSNNHIAKELDISSMTVGRVRVAMQEEAKTPAQTTVTYVDKHGNTTTMKTDKKKKATTPTTKPDVTTANPEVKELEQKVKELATTVNTLAEENTVMRDKIAVGQWDASEIEKIDAEETIKNLREQIRVLEIDNKSMRESRDIYQNENAEMMRTIKSLKAKLKKYETV
jgi:ParB-like chromosome segregation protein Spo0J